MRKIAALTVALLCLSGVAMAQQPAKNVFVMISDGASFGAWDAASLYQTKDAPGGPTTCAPSYYGSEFSKYLMSTYPLNTSSKPTGGSVSEIGYDAAQAWGLDSYANGSASYLHQNATDSAAAGTALSTGVKTYNNAMNWSNDNLPITTMPELAKQAGKVVGTVSSVQWSHATPAAFSDAHNVTRNNYISIANEMLRGDAMDVIMGCGNPMYDDSGNAKYAAYNDPGINDNAAKYVGGWRTWMDLNEGTHAGNWSLVTEGTDFDALASGDMSSLAGRDRLLAMPKVGGTLQQSRSGYSITDTPGMSANSVPTLETMTKAALNALGHLDTEGKGMFLQIEGGAIDWAAHANQTSRLVEEQIDFNNSVDAVIAWIEANGGWEENLLVITTDHGNAMPLGVDSDTVAHDRVELADILAGQYKAGENEQGVRWWSGGHTNELVPLFARGVCAGKFDDLVDGTDSAFGTYYADWAATGFDGRYVDNTDVFAVTNCAFNVPEPATLGLLALGGLALVRRRR